VGPKEGLVSYRLSGLLTIRLVCLRGGTAVQTARAASKNSILGAGKTCLTQPRVAAGICPLALDSSVFTVFLANTTA
jgi:hypothetical protein